MSLKNKGFCAKTIGWKWMAHKLLLFKIENYLQLIKICTIFIFKRNQPGFLMTNLFFGFEKAKHL